MQEAFQSSDTKALLLKLIPLLSGADGQRLMGLLYLTGSDPARLRSALEKAIKGDGQEAREMLSRLTGHPEGAAIVAKLAEALKG